MISSNILAAKQPFRLGVYTFAGTLGPNPSNNGFSLDYTQVLYVWCV